MALFQPSNITPSSFAGFGQGTVDANDSVRVSWQLNGNSPMVAFKIDIYRNTGDSIQDTTPIVTSGKITVTPVYPVDNKGNPIFYTYTPNTTWQLWSSNEITNGNAYKLKITQWWNNDNYIEQFSESAFITRAKPTLTIDVSRTAQTNLIKGASYHFESTSAFSPTSSDLGIIYCSSISNIVGTRDNIEALSEMAFGQVAPSSWGLNDTNDIIDNAYSLSNLKFDFVFDHFNGDVSTISYLTADGKITNNDLIINSYKHTFTATYNQAQGDNVNSVEWQFVDNDGNIIDDTGSISTAQFSYTYDGLLSGKTYKIRCIAVTENGQIVDTGFINVYCTYTQVQNTGDLSLECKNDTSVKLTWGAAVNIPKTSESGTYTVDTNKQTLTLNENSFVGWDEVNSEEMNFTQPNTIGWKGLLNRHKHIVANVTVTPTITYKTFNITTNIQKMLDVYYHDNNILPDDLFDNNTDVRFCGNRNFVLAYGVGGQYIAKSSDGEIWTGGDKAITATKIIYANNKFIGVGTYIGENAVINSTNGENWSGIILSETELDNYNWFDIAYGNGKYIMIGKAKSGNLGYRYIATSTDGTIWQYKYEYGLGNFTHYNINFVNDRFYMTVFEDDDVMGSYCRYSLTGENDWVGITLDNQPTVSGLRTDVVYNGSVYAFCYIKNNYLYSAYSTDGVHFKSKIIKNIVSTDSANYGLSAGLGFFYLVVSSLSGSSYTNLLYRSTNGETWEQEPNISWAGKRFTFSTLAIGKFFWWDSTPTGKTTRLFYTTASYISTATFTPNNEWAKDITVYQKSNNVRTVQIGEQQGLTRPIEIGFILTSWFGNGLGDNVTASFGYSGYSVNSTGQTIIPINNLTAFKGLSSTFNLDNITINRNGNNITVIVYTPTKTESGIQNSQTGTVTIQVITDDTFNDTVNYFHTIWETSNLRLKLYEFNDGENLPFIYSAYLYSYSGNTETLIAHTDDINDIDGIYDLQAVIYVTNNKLTFTLLKANENQGIESYTILSQREVDISNYAMTDITAIKLIGKQICDWLYIGKGEKALSELSTSNYQPYWNSDTLFLANFKDELLNAGTFSTSGNIRNAIYRQDKDSNNLEIVYRIPTAVTQLKDYTLRSKERCKYVIFYSDSTEYSTPIESTETCRNFTAYTLIEAKQDEEYPTAFHVVKVWRFGNNINAGSITNNNAPTFLNNFTKYPLRQINTQAPISGTLSALLSNVRDGEYADTVEQMQRLFDISLSNNHFFLKDMKGNLYEVAPSGAIQQTINTKSAVQQVTVSIPYKEVGDASDVSIIQLPTDDGWEE